MNQSNITDLNRSDGPMSAYDVAKFLNRSLSYIYKLTSANGIPYYKIPGGKSLLFKRSEITKWAYSHKVSTMEELEQQAIDVVTLNPTKHAA